MSEITYGDLSLDEFFAKFDTSRWICKCGHNADRHPDLEVSGYTEACWDCTECQQLSDEPITVLELLNKHYGTDWDAPDYAVQLPGKWSHVLASGPYNRNLTINNTVSREVHGYDDALSEANYKVLQENWEGHPALIDGGFSNCYSIGLQWNSPAPWDLIETVESLENYPVLDDELMSNIETEWANEHWDDYGILDARRELAKQMEFDESDLELDFDELNDALRDDIRWSENHPPYHESGGGTVFSDEVIIAENLTKYRLILVKTYEPCGVCGRFGHKTKDHDDD